MGVREMNEVASLYARVLLHDEDPKTVRQDVQHLKSDFQHVHYCFDSESFLPMKGCEFHRFTGHRRGQRSIARYAHRRHHCLETA